MVKPTDAITIPNKRRPGKPQNFRVRTEQKKHNQQGQRDAATDAEGRRKGIVDPGHLTALERNHQPVIPFEKRKEKGLALS